MAAIGALNFRTPDLETRPFAFMSRPVPRAEPSAVAFGESGEVVLRFAMPGRTIEYPLDVHGDPTSLGYEWIRLGSEKAEMASRPLRGDKVVAPVKAGFYRLNLVRGHARRIVEGLTLAVLVPFEEKEGSMLNGYRIGTYIGERLGNRGTPEGFLEITARDVDLQITKHLKVSDFLSHDRQEVWPRYAAVSPRLLDKLELVIAEITRWHGATTEIDLALDVRSGFRSPDHNRRIRRAARDSQHQYGDAADVALDANGDGRLTAMDSRMVGLAVEIVELKHPSLVGGLGLYTGRRSSYVHIDARGKRARWRG
ncbi:MAG: D-Ala-D-Ala carboxypeptidase family metallohydrolase [Thermomicrobiales bacterium]